MSEVRELTKDITETSVRELTERSRRDVFVRTPRRSGLTKVLAGMGATVLAEAGGGLSVTGMDAWRIASAAAERHIPIQELTPRSASLEDAGGRGPNTDSTSVCSESSLAVRNRTRSSTNRNASRTASDIRPPAGHAGHFDVITNGTCPPQVRMDDLDHGHHSWLVVGRAMLDVVSDPHVRADRQAQRVALHPSRGPQASLRPRKLSPNQRDKRDKEDYFTLARCNNGGSTVSFRGWTPLIPSTSCDDAHRA